MKKLLWIFGTIALLAGAIYAYNYFTLIQPTDRDTASDSRNEGILMAVHYEHYIIPQTLVLDLQAVPEGKAPADVFRVLLQQASALKDKKFDTVLLAFQGKTKFILDGSYFNTLGMEFGEQNPIYTIRTFSENLLDDKGKNPYAKWEGGLLGVMGKQMEDFNDFHRKWYLADIGAVR